jgi:hypothetical protein
MLVPAATSRSFYRILFLIFALIAVFFFPNVESRSSGSEACPNHPPGKCSTQGEPGDRGGEGSGLAALRSSAGSAAA